MQVKNIRDEFVVFSPAKRAHCVALTADLYARLDRDYDGFQGHELVSAYDFSGDWNCWEMHPNGDEVVILISGSATFVLELNDEHQLAVLSRPGDRVVVPRGVWHTARVSEAATVLFVTPGEGTLHRDL